MLVAACDPGLEGAIAFNGRSYKTRTREEVNTAFLQLATDALVNLVWMRNIVADKKEINNRVVLYLEDVHYMHTDGKKQVWTFSAAVERIKMAACIYNIPIKLVSPQKWQGALNLLDNTSGLTKLEKYELSKSKKRRLKIACRELYGRDDIYEWNADAFLILHYAKLQEVDEEF